MTRYSAETASVRDLIERTVLERATHDSPDKVGDTRSFANMETTLTREYWGRFLIELLQNARDAWLAGRNGGREGIVRIRLTKEPALVVCNQGDPLTPEVVLQSISKFGESPKPYGTAIGHKGIGFKAVLELTRVPRLYSRLDSRNPFDLKVRFDPDEARDLVLGRSPNWDQMVSGLLSSGFGDGGGSDRIPVLRYPLWDENPPVWLDEVAEVDGRRFNTVVVLPYDSRFEGQLGLSREDFIGRAQQAIRELSDEVVLLLSVFRRVLIEDEVAGERHEIIRTEPTTPDSPSPGLTVSEVVIARDGTTSARWWLFERSLAGHIGLEGDIAVGVRLADGEDGTPIPVGPSGDLQEGGGADCFHLFFPTKIRTHLPFLFHAYFETDAGRKGFAEDKEVANRARLVGLVDLAAEATRYIVDRSVAGKLNLIGLPGLFAAASGEPDDKLARFFRDQLLAKLDHERWVEVVRDGPVSFEAPTDLLIDARTSLPELLPVAFPYSYVHRRLGRAYALTSDRDGLQFLAVRNAIARGTADAGGLDAACLADLLHPDDLGIWTVDIDGGFRALLQVLDQTRRDADIRILLEDIRSDPAAVFIPVVGPGGQRRLRPPGQRRQVSGAEDLEEVGGILARVSVTNEAPLVPPPILGLDFLADGVVDAELLNGIGARLGIRPYQTESILDAIAASPDEPDVAPELLVFAWRLLLRERVSGYSVANALRDSTIFEPGRWFWSRPGSNRADGARDVRRSRALARVRLPTMAGDWRAAGDLAFGAEWADWEDESKHGVGSTAADRSLAYRDLDAAAPGPEVLVAGPAKLAALLTLDEDDVRWSESETGPELPSDRGERHRLLLHAFLLRLGVWEIPPISGHVDYRYPRPESVPPWAVHRDWSEYQASVAESEADFIKFKHKNVHVAEDYQLAWPLRSDSSSVRALSRGAPAYQKFQRAELFCPQCTTSGTWHSKRYSSDGEPRIPSSLRWQLTQQSWLPTTVGNGPTVAMTPSDAWQEEDRPDDVRMQQSWMRFLPLVAPEVQEKLISLLGIPRLREADAPRIVRLLKALRSQFDAGQIDPDRRAGSFESQALCGLHWRLYEQLAKRYPTVGEAALRDVEVLASIGRTTAYRPTGQVRHDDGAFSAYKRYFTGQVAFSVLPRDLGMVGDAIGIPRFGLSLKRVSGGRETSVTERVRSYVHERAAEFLALQVFHPLGTQALQLDGRAFALRAERLRRLEVIQVDDLVLRVEVLGLGLVKEIGAGRGEDMFLDDRSNPPVLYHDLQGALWEERFRVLAGPYLATLLDNPAYSATFQLLLQQDTPADVEAYLDEQSISEDDLGVVRRHMELISGILRTDERRWWSALLPLLGVMSSTASDADVYRKDTSEALAVAETRHVPGLAARLLRAGGGEIVRKDASIDGALAVLEEIGVSLALLHDRLQAAGDPGLTLQVAARLLADWRRIHGREVSAILARRGIDPDAARTLPEGWTVGSGLAFQIHVGPSEFLAPVVTDLLRGGLVADPVQMVGVDASAYLASLIDETPDSLASAWRGLFDEQERARLDHENVLAWRLALRPVLVAARTRPGDTPSNIRTAAEDLDRLLGPSPANSRMLAERLQAVLGDAIGLSEALHDLVVGDRTLATPSALDVRQRAVVFIDVDHLDRVLNVLKRGQRQFVDQVRQDIDKVKEAGIIAKPFAGSEPASGPKKRAAGTPARIGPRRAHDQRKRDRLGVQGERAALAAVIDAILVRPVIEQNRIINDLIDLLLEVAEEGEIVNSLVAEGRNAIAAADDDDRIESLARFLWVAAKSDDFGFDLLGYLSPYVGADARPLVLEVKNSADRSFMVSAAEWRRAQDQGERYAFFVVVRSEGDTPVAMELIPNPPLRLELGELGRREEIWKLNYRPEAAAEPSGETRTYEKV